VRDQTKELARTIVRPLGQTQGMTRSLDRRQPKQVNHTKYRATHPTFAQQPQQVDNGSGLLLDYPWQMIEVETVLLIL
jgi:hypothetical protein